MVESDTIVKFEENVKDEMKIDLRIISKGDSFADINLSMKDYKDEISRMNNMNEAGRFSYSKMNNINLTMFPLPRQNLALFGVDSLPISYPLRARNITCEVSGFNIVTYLKDTVIKGNQVAVLKGEMNVSKFSIPKDYKGKVRTYMIGSGKYYFDFKRSCFILAEVKTEMYVYVKSVDIHEKEMKILTNMKIVLDKVSK